MYKISVIIPVYNAEKHIMNLLDSIVKQNYNNYEVIIVDDGSKDKSAKIIEEYKTKYPDVIKYYYQDNAGPGFARKKGYINATGELISYIDSDDWMEGKDVLSRINKIFEEYNPDMLLYDRKTYPNQEKLTPFYGNNKIKKGMHDISFLYKNEIRACLGLKVLKREYMNESFFSKTFNYEDFFTTYLYMDNIKNFYYDNEIYQGVNRYDDNISLTRVFSFSKVLNAFQNIIETYDRVNNKKLHIPIAYTALNAYTYLYIKPIFNFKFSIKQIKIIKPYAKKLKKIIKENDIDEFEGSITSKRKLFYKIFLKK